MNPLAVAIATWVWLVIPNGYAGGSAETRHGEELKERAAEATAEVRETARESSQETAEASRQAAQQVREEAEGAAGQLKDQASSSTEAVRGTS